MVPVCTTCRHHHLFKKRAPKMTVHVGRPIYPDPDLSIPERKKALRNRVYDFMIDMTSEHENIEWVRYVKAPKNESKE